MIREMPSLETGFFDAPLRLLPEIGELASLTGFIEDFGMRHDWAAADTHAFWLAAEELFANTLRHCQPAARSVEFSLAVDEVMATATYSDDGPAFDPTAQPEVDTSLPLAERPIGGLGIHFIRRTMQTFTYERRDGRNVVRFGRPLNSRSSG